MSNKASSHLFELIKSLNKSEKRYFKVFSSRHTIGEENSYIKLFDFIDKMDEYDEEKVFTHFMGKALLNKFSITKARLYQNILKSLDTFHSTSSIDAQIFRSIHSAEILYNKGLYKQSEKILNSAEKQAKKHENFNLLLEIKQKQKRLIENELYTEVNAEQIAKMFAEEKSTIQEIETYHKLWNVKSLLFQDINRNGKVRNEEDTIKLKELVEQVESMNTDVVSTKSQYLFHHIQSAYYFSVNDLELSHYHLKSIIKLLEDNTVLAKEKPNIYFSALTNIIYISTRLKKYEDAQSNLSKLKTLANPGVSIDLDIKYFSSTYSLELSLLREKGDYAKALQLIPQIEEGYRLYGSHINSLRKAYIDFQVGVIYLGLGNYSKALQWINNILNENKIDQKQDIYCFAQLINLVLHFELNNVRFLPYAINSTKRYLKNRNRIYRFEEVFLKLISQMSKSNNTFDLQEKLIPIEIELIKLKEDPKEQIVFEYFDFLIWVQSKLTEKPFLELKQEELQVA
jgi:tetratricopeptide (TPR) repeat protein